MNKKIILDALVKAASKTEKSYGDYSVTDLLNPVQQVILWKRYSDTLPLTYEDVFSTLIGNAAHDAMAAMLRRYQVVDPKFSVERSINIPIFLADTVRILSGRYDLLYDNKHLWDLKTAKTWHKVFDPDLKEWTEQLNIYNYMLYTKGIKLESLNILAYYKDWQENIAIRNRDYPQADIEQYQVNMWKIEDVANFIKKQVQRLYECENIADYELPKCNAEETWARFADGSSEQFAVFKNKIAKRAVKVFNDRFEAIKYMATEKRFGAESFIEVRHAVCKRCEKYCRVAPVCYQYKEYIEKKRSNTLNTIIKYNEVR